jgi:hypothetical protein
MPGNDRSIQQPHLGSTHPKSVMAKHRALFLMNKSANSAEAAPRRPKVPILLGNGVRLFDKLGTAPIELESIRVIEAPGVTHLGFRVVK